MFFFEDLHSWDFISKRHGFCFHHVYHLSEKITITRTRFVYFTQHKRHYMPFQRDEFFSFEKIKLRIPMRKAYPSIGRSVDWSATHSSDDPHGACVSPLGCVFCLFHNIIMSDDLLTVSMDANFGISLSHER